MTYIFGNWLKCLRNDQNIWEMTQICWKWLKYVGKLLNYLTNGLKMWNMTFEMAQIHGARLKYLRNGLTILEMA